MISFAAILAVLMGGSLPTASSAAPCPAAVPNTRAIVEKFLTSEAHASSRQETGTVGISGAQVRLLTDALDAAACTRLNEILGGAGSYGSWVWSYYAAGDRYFVAMQYVQTGDVHRIGWVPLLVYDPGFNRVGGYAM